MLSSIRTGISNTLSSRTRRSSRQEVIDHRIRPEEVRLGKKIGEGGFGEVYIATFAKRQVVAKKVKIEAMGEAAALRGLEDELSVAVKLRNPCVVQIFGAVITADTIMLIMEYCGNGSLRAKLDERPRCTLTRDQRVAILGEAAEGLKYLTQRGIIHRDVKADNVLLDSGLHAKLADFGLSSDLEAAASDQNIAGTIPFMAPELLKKTDGKAVAYSEKSDVYAYGCLAIEVLGGGGPWQGHAQTAAEVIARVQQGQMPPLPPNLPVELAALVKACLAPDRTARPTFDKIVAALDSFDSASSKWDPTAATEEEQLELARQMLINLLQQTMLEEAEASQPLWPGAAFQKGDHVRVVGTSLGAGHVKLGDVGVVQGRSEDHSHFTIDFIAQDGWAAKASDLALDLTAQRVRPGARCALRPSVSEPRFGMGNLQPGMVGLCHTVSHDGIAKINFGFNGAAGKADDGLWAAPLSELMAVTEGGTWLGGLQCGHAVRIRRGLEAPSTGWGAVTAKSVGYVRAWMMVAQSIYYVVDFPEMDGWKGKESDLEIDQAANMIRPGVRVRVRADVAKPKYGWGGAGVSHATVGVVRSISYDGNKVRIRFRGAPGWCGLLSELEPLPDAGVLELVADALISPFVGCFQPTPPEATLAVAPPQPSLAPPTPTRATAPEDVMSGGVARRRLKKVLTASRVTAGVVVNGEKGLKKL